MVVTRVDKAKAVLRRVNGVGGVGVVSSRVRSGWACLVGVRGASKAAAAVHKVVSVVLIVTFGSEYP